MSRPAFGAGFTLVESLLAVALLALALSAILGMVQATRDTAHEAQHQARALSLAQQSVQHLMGLDYAALDDYDGQVEPPGELVDAHGDPHEPAYQAFERRISVQPHEQSIAALGHEVPGKRIAVTIEGPRGRQWELQSFRAEPRP